MSCFFGRAGAGLATQGSSLRILGGGEEDERTNDSSDSGFLWRLSGTERERERGMDREGTDRAEEGKEDDFVIGKSWLFDQGCFPFTTLTRFLPLFITT